MPRAHQHLDVASAPERLAEVGGEAADVGARPARDADAETRRRRTRAARTRGRAPGGARARPRCRPGPAREDVARRRGARSTWAAPGRSHPRSAAARRAPASAPAGGTGRSAVTRPVASRVSVVTPRRTVARYSLSWPWRYAVSLVASPRRIGKEAGGHGIQRAAVADLGHAEYAPEMRDYLEGRDTRALVGEQEAVRRPSRRMPPRSPRSALTAARRAPPGSRRARASSPRPVPRQDQPGGVRVPAATQAAATRATLTSPLARRLTLTALRQLPEEHRDLRRPQRAGVVHELLRLGQIRRLRLRAVDHQPGDRSRRRPSRRPGGPGPRRRSPPSWRVS